MGSKTHAVEFKRGVNTKELKGNDDDNEEEVNVLKDKCEKWLEGCSIADSSSVYSDSDASVFTDTTTNSALESGLVLNDEIVVANRILANQNNEIPCIIKETSGAKYENVNIYKSRKVHVGDVTYINGPVLITNGDSGYSNKKLSVPYNDPGWDANFIINRVNWLAQPALGQREYLDGPAKYVIIAHTATEEGFTQADNTLHIRLIQTFHIESRKWKDISYNFLIGSDGLAYEGRGWGVIGSHTRNYNSKSLGIAFIGCFLDHLPPAKSLKKAQDLIEFGVKRGSIAEDYILLAHCQCSAIESPGKRLFEEIQTWKHWDGSISPPKSSFKTDDIKEPADDDVPRLKTP